MHSRLIADCELNDRMALRIDAGMPRIYSVQDLMSKFKYCAVVDFRSYFNAFGLSDAVSAFFCWRTGRRGGKSRLQRLRRMPMGWTAAPGIAQRVANLIIRVLGLTDCALTWIDNTFIGGDSEEEVRQRLAAFLDLCAKLKLECKVEYVGQSPRHLGMEADLVAGTFVIARDWAGKVVTAIDGVRRQPQGPGQEDWDHLTGCLVWALYLTRRSMMALRHTLACWEVRGPLSLAIQKELDDMVSFLQSPTPTPLAADRRETADLELVTDSSSFAGAALWKDYGGGQGPKSAPVTTTLSWAWQGRRHINLLELAAIDVGLRHIVADSDGRGDRLTGRRVRVHTDNLVCLAVLNARYAHSKPLQDILEGILKVADKNDMVIEPVYVPTAENEADWPSRHPGRTRRHVHSPFNIVEDNVST